MNAVWHFGWLAVPVAAGVLQSANASDERETQWRWEDVPRVVAFSDVHGAHEQLVSLLQAADIVDDQLRWTGGETHVVSVGDLIDRGPDSRGVLDLVMRLQEEASAAGGHFHVVLGNHELMNMMADFRYVTDEDFAAFAGEESVAIRDSAFTHFRAAHGPRPVEESRAEFDGRYPPGYFGRRAAFAPTGRYGRWLLGLPLIVVIDDSAFVHGGLSPLVSKLGGAALNENLRREVRDFLELWHRFVEAGVVAWDADAVIAADEVAAMLKDNSNSSTKLDDSILTAAREFVELSESPALNEHGPLWYRGTAWCHPLLESAVLEPALERLDVGRVIVGHSPTSNRRIVSRMGGRVILVDTGMFAPHFHGRPAALVIERSRLAAIYPGEPDRTTLSHEKQNVAATHGDVDQLQQTLTSGALTENGQADRSYRLLAVSAGDDELPVRFTSSRGHEHEIAAYRLDRELGLGMVPPGVLRSVDGKSGALTVWSETLVTETERIDTDFERPNWCAAGNDYQLMYVFDALIRNRNRTTDTIRYTQPQKRLWLADHLASFGTEPRVSDYLRRTEVVVPPTLADRLASLDERRLKALLGDLLSGRQIRAILKRRDEIFELWPTGAPGNRATIAAREPRNTGRWTPPTFANDSAAR